MSRIQNLLLRSASATSITYGSFADHYGFKPVIEEVTYLGNVAPNAIINLRLNTVTIPVTSSALVFPEDSPQATLPNLASIYKTAHKAVYKYVDGSTLTLPTEYAAIVHHAEREMVITTCRVPYTLHYLGNKTMYCFVGFYGTDVVLFAAGKNYAMKGLHKTAGLSHKDYVVLDMNKYADQRMDYYRTVPLRDLIDPKRKKSVRSANEEEEEEFEHVNPHVQGVVDGVEKLSVAGEQLGQEVSTSSSYELAQEVLDSVGTTDPIVGSSSKSKKKVTKKREFEDESQTLETVSNVGSLESFDEKQVKKVLANKKPRSFVDEMGTRYNTAVVEQHNGVVKLVKVKAMMTYQEALEKAMKGELENVFEGTPAKAKPYDEKGIRGRVLARKQISST